jgi:antitoxin ParD1/3/4
MGKSAIEQIMSITLTPEQESLVQALLETGRFSTSEQVILVALRLLKKAQREEQEWIEEARAKVNEGLAEIERGETLDGETFIKQLREKLEQKRASG